MKEILNTLAIQLPKLPINQVKGKNLAVLKGVYEIGSTFKENTNKAKLVHHVN